MIVGQQYADDHCSDLGHFVQERQRRDQRDDGTVTWDAAHVDAATDERQWLAHAEQSHALALGRAEQRHIETDAAVGYSQYDVVPTSLDFYLG